MIMAGYEAVNSSLWKNTDMYLSDQIKGIASLYLLSVSTGTIDCRSDSLTPSVDN